MPISFSIKSHRTSRKGFTPFPRPAAIPPDVGNGFFGARFMNTTAKRTATLFVLGLLALIIGAANWGRWRNRPAIEIAGSNDLRSLADNVNPQPPKTAPVATIAPFIIHDTATDSPGTNIVTRIVTMTAEVGGTPPPALQWEVEHGKGYELLAGATNNTFRIGNAQVYDSGFYSLFATNAAGNIRTAPLQLIVTEGED